LNRSAFTSLEDVRTITVDNQAEAKFGTGPFAHTLLLGADYQRALYDAVKDSGTGPSINAYAPVYGAPVSTPPTITNSHQTLSQLGFYAQDQVKLGNWVAQFSGREDLTSEATDDLLKNQTTSQSADAFTKRAALLYHFDNGFAPYIQYTESFQPTIGTGFNGAPFKPTTGEQEEAGLKYQPPGTKTLATVAVFDLTEYNALTPDPTHVGFNVQTGAVRATGVEVEGKTTLPNGLNLTAAYTYLDVRNVAAANGTVGDRLPIIPTQQASLWGDYTIPWGSLAGFGFGSGVRYLGPSPANTTNTYYIPGATLVDAGIHYDFAYRWPQLKGLYLALNAQNLLDTAYVQDCQNTGCEYGLRRSIIGTVRYRF
jgi:iron complex outermembrane recepter protein